MLLFLCVNYVNHDLFFLPLCTTSGARSFITVITYFFIINRDLEKFNFRRFGKLRAGYKSKGGNSRKKTNNWQRFNINQLKSWNI